MKELILLKCGELALKGLNRHTFEDALVKNCRRRIESLGTFEFYKAQSAIYIEPRGTDIDLDDAFGCRGKEFRRDPCAGAQLSGRRA